MFGLERNISATTTFAVLRQGIARDVDSSNRRKAEKRAPWKKREFLICAHITLKTGIISDVRIIHYSHRSDNRFGSILNRFFSNFFRKLLSRYSKRPNVICTIKSNNIRLTRKQLSIQNQVWPSAAELFI